MKTIQLTDEMVERLQHFYNLPECCSDDEIEEGVKLATEIAETLFKKK